MHQTSNHRNNAKNVNQSYDMYIIFPMATICVQVSNKYFPKYILMITSATIWPPPALLLIFLMALSAYGAHPGALGPWGLLWGKVQFGICCHLSVATKLWKGEWKNDDGTILCLDEKNCKIVVGQFIKIMSRLADSGRTIRSVNFSW